MGWFAEFSKNYAGGITAVVAVSAFILAAFTLWFVRREYQAKYRPLVLPIPTVSRADGPEDQEGYSFLVTPRGLGSHPCYAKFTSVALVIGDETYATPDNQEWMLLGPAAGWSLPVGHINAEGLGRIREGRYRSNRVEIRFELHTKSAENEFESTATYAYEVDVRGAEPVVTIRPEWIRRNT